ncbi:MAG: glycosyltransferase family 2 protein [Candidatus Amesbacteria bacterium]|nr:glycosyltransferase family 2 protein [Candidatus Amesbacteria bacterium]
MLSVIIINHNTPEITKKCVECVLASKNIKLEIILVNNTPSDKFSFPGVKIINNKTPHGFGANNNIGMKVAKGDKILLLNSDAYVYPDTLAKCYAQDYDVLGCQLLNEDLSIQPSWGYFPTLRRIFQFQVFVDNFPIIRKYIDSIHVRDLSRFKTTQKVDWVMGAFTMLKREVYEKTGGFDENFFMYGEEVELQFRSAKLAFETWYYPEAKSVHLARQSNTFTTSFLGEMQGYLYWFKKYNSPLEQFLLKLVLLFGCAIRIPAWSVWGKWDLVKSYIQVLPLLLKEF